MASSFVWFDLGYTLLYKPREQEYAAVLAEHGIEVPLEQLEKEFHLVDKLFMREYPSVFGRDPETFMPWFLGVLHNRLGIRLNLCEAWGRLKEVHARTRHRWLAFENVPEVLADLRGRGVRMGVITNWDPSARRLLEELGLSGYFEQVVVSCEEGSEKPDPRIFQAALRRAGVAGGECLYVGDNYYADAVGARGVGMRALIVNRFGRLGVEEIADQLFIRDVSEVVDYIR
jgi:putative hydrolase of the HAD superfamily